MTCSGGSSAATAPGTPAMPVVASAAHASAATLPVRVERPTASPRRDPSGAQNQRSFRALSTFSRNTKRLSRWIPALAPVRDLQLLDPVDPAGPQPPGLLE